MQIKKEKALLRKRAKSLRSSVENRELLSGKIAERLFSLEAYLSCGSVFAYYSYGSEVETRLIIEKALSDGKKVALPRCEADGKMSFCFFKSFSELENGLFKGILEPKEKSEMAEADEKTLLIVPALAFGKDKTRLGHGMGCYDRFLSGFNGTSAGLCFEKCLFETLPQEETDRTVSLVVTENRVISGQNH